MSVRAGALLLVVSLVGCAHYRVTCPYAGGRPWLDVKTAHLTLLTDLPVEPATRMARDSERWLVAAAATTGYFLPGAAEPGRTTMVMFAEVRRRWQALL